MLIRRHTLSLLSGAGWLQVYGQPCDVRFLIQHHMHMQGLGQTSAYATSEVLLGGWLVSPLTQATSTVLRKLRCVKHTYTTPLIPKVMMTTNTFYSASYIRSILKMLISSSSSCCPVLERVTILRPWSCRAASMSLSSSGQRWRCAISIRGAVCFDAKSASELDRGEEQNVG